MKTAKPQTALVSGASSGIGRELARVFARNSFDLVLVARNRPRLTELAEELRATYAVEAQVISTDLFDPAAPRELFRDMQRAGVEVDVLVNNAGLGLRGALAECDLTDLLHMVQLNVVAVTHLTRLFVPPMLQRGAGRILNVASIAAFLPGPLTAVYNASKAYVLSLSEALANELQGTGVTLTVLCPGPTRTRFDERSGATHTRAFSGKVMDPASVAQAGFDGLVRGKRMVVPGLLNKMRMVPIHLVPRPVLADFSRKYHEEQPVANEAVAPGFGSAGGWWNGHAWLHGHHWWHARSWLHGPWWQGRRKQAGYRSSGSP